MKDRVGRLRLTKVRASIGCHVWLHSVTEDLTPDIYIYSSLGQHKKRLKFAFTLVDFDWIWTETGLVPDLPVEFTLDCRSSSGLWV